MLAHRVAPPPAKTPWALCNDMATERVSPNSPSGLCIPSPAGHLPSHEVHTDHSLPCALCPLTPDHAHDAAAASSLPPASLQSRLADIIAHKRFTDLEEMCGGDVNHLLKTLGVHISRSGNHGIWTSSVPARRMRFGANVLPTPARSSLWKFVVGSIREDLTMQILIASSLISMLLGLTMPNVHTGKADHATGWIEGMAILVSVAVVTSVNAVNNYRRQEQFAHMSLLESANRHQITVFRHCDESYARCSCLALHAPSRTLNHFTQHMTNFHGDANDKGTIRPVDYNANDDTCDDGKEEGEEEKEEEKVKEVTYEDNSGYRYAHHKLSSTEAVVGDIVHIIPGMELTFDALLIRSFGPIIVDESAITGETEDVHKQTLPGDCFLISGTVVVDGSAEGEAVVCAIGTHSFAGQIAMSVHTTEKTSTPLQVQLESMAASIGKLGMVAAALIFTALTLKELFSCCVLSRPDASPSSFPIIRLFQNLTTAVAIVVVTVPEGLPLSVTITLAYTMQRMMREGILVRHLAACETMGGATVLCTDKTGTLTEPQMHARCVFVGERSYDRRGRVGCRGLCTRATPTPQTRSELCNDFSYEGGRSRRQAIPAPAASCFQHEARAASNVGGGDKNRSGDNYCNRTRNRGVMVTSNLRQTQDHYANLYPNRTGVCSDTSLKHRTWTTATTRGSPCSSKNENAAEEEEEDFFELRMARRKRTEECNGFPHHVTNKAGEADEAVDGAAMGQAACFVVEAPVEAVQLFMDCVVSNAVSPELGKASNKTAASLLQLTEELIVRQPRQWVDTADNEEMEGDEELQQHQQQQQQQHALLRPTLYAGSSSRSHPVRQLAGDDTAELTMTIASSPPHPSLFSTAPPNDAHTSSLASPLPTSLPTTQSSARLTSRSASRADAVATDNAPAPTASCTFGHTVSRLLPVLRDTVHCQRLPISAMSKMSTTLIAWGGEGGVAAAAEKSYRRTRNSAPKQSHHSSVSPPYVPPQVTLSCSPTSARFVRHYVSGAAEWVWRRCDRHLDGSGAVRVLTPATRAMYEEVIQRYNRAGLRTIGCAYADVRIDAHEAGTLWFSATTAPFATSSAVARHAVGMDGLPHQKGLCVTTHASGGDAAATAASVSLCMLGLIGLEEVVRDDVPSAMQRCVEGRLRVIVITGDSALTAENIAWRCGACVGDGVQEEQDSPPSLRHAHAVLDGPVFRAMEDEVLVRQYIPQLCLLARATPLDKRRLIYLLRRAQPGAVIAMTGDGTNDAPALKLSDVGFAMNSGSDVAKQASDIVLLNNNFSGMVAAMIWGRNIKDNIRKFLQFQLTVNLAACAVSLGGALLSSENDSPLTPVQLLWMNLIMDTLAALALATELPDETALLQRAPESASAPIILPCMWVNIITQTLYQTVVQLVLLCGGATVLNTDAYISHRNIVSHPNSTKPASVPNMVDDVTQKSLVLCVVFNTFVWMQIFNFFNARLLRQKFVMRLLWTHSRALLCIVAGIALMQIIMVQYGGEFMSTIPLSRWHWFLCIALGMGSLCVGTASRWYLHAPRRSLLPIRLLQFWRGVRHRIGMRQMYVRL